jgi:hypothetical protein
MCDLRDRAAVVMGEWNAFAKEVGPARLYICRLIGLHVHGRVVPHPGLRLLRWIELVETTATSAPRDVFTPSVAKRPRSAL